MKFQYTINDEEISLTFGMLSGAQMAELSLRLIAALYSSLSSLNAEKATCFRQLITHAVSNSNSPIWDTQKTINGWNSITIDNSAEQEDKT